MPARHVVLGRCDLFSARELRDVLCGVVLCARKYRGLDESVRGRLRVRVANDGEHAAGTVPCGLLLPRRISRGSAVPCRLLLARRRDVHVIRKLFGVRAWHDDDGRRPVIMLAADYGRVGRNHHGAQQFRPRRLLRVCVHWGLLRHFPHGCQHRSVVLDHVPDCSDHAHARRIRLLYFRDGQRCGENARDDCNLGRPVTPGRHVDKLHRVVLDHVNGDDGVQQRPRVCEREARLGVRDARRLLCTLHDESCRHRDGLLSRWLANVVGRDQVTIGRALVRAHVVYLYAEPGDAV